MNKVKQLFFLIVLIGIGYISEAQDIVPDFLAGKSREDIIAWQKQVGDKWFNEHVDEMLKAGDKMPDIPLGTVINNYTGKTRLSEFKGRLVILDFWNTYCTTCIATWPEMEALQRKFGTQIQIFLVNTIETKEQINKRLIILNKNKKGEKEIKIPTNLPVITGPREDLLKIFPIRTVPHHVWIDGAGTLRVIGPFQNTNAEKIEKLLAGKRIDFLNGNNNTPNYQPKIPYYKLINWSIQPQEYISFFSLYNNNIAGTNVGIACNVTDTIHQTVRNTYINFPMYSLYYEYFNIRIGHQINPNWFLFGPSTNEFSTGGRPEDFSLFLFSDTSIFSLKNNDGALTDKNYSKDKVCYEQITSIDMAEDERKELMLYDLNNYYGKLYGVTASLEKHRVPCFILVRTSKEDKLSTNKPSSEKRFPENGKIMVQRSVSSLSFLIRNTIVHSSISNLFKQTKNGFPLYFINETGYPAKQRVEMILPDAVELKSMKDLRKALKRYDLDIIQGERELNFVVFQEKGMARK
jgi:thiol-disulfide isomerase/thioredoxin